MVKVKIPATTANLGPGFDCLGMSLCLYNYVQVNISNDGLKIEQKGCECSDIPLDEKNLVYKSIKKVYEYVGKSIPDFHIILENNIPITRGLGSSAAAVVGGIRAANELLGNPLSMNEMLELATQEEGHPDNVAPALLGGIVLSIKGNGKFFTHRIEPFSLLKAVVAIPEFTLSTKLARSVMPNNYSLEDVVFNISRMGLLMSGFETGNIELLKFGMDDVIHQPYRSKLVPGMEEILQTSKENGAIGVALSGAGPCILALCTENSEHLGEHMVRTLQKWNVPSRYVILNPDLVGCQIV